MVDVAHALSFLHDKDILHLDVKPSNILVGVDMNNKLEGAIYG